MNRILITYPLYDFFTDIFLCTVEGCILIELMNRLYGKIQKYRKTAYTLFALAVLFMLVVTHWIFPSYGCTYLVVPASFLLLPFYPGSRRKKALFSFCLATVNLLYLLALNDITNVLPNLSLALFYLLLYHIGLWALLFLCLKLCRQISTDIPLRLLLLLFAIPLCTLVASPILLIFLSSAIDTDRTLSSLLHFVLQLLFLSINLLTFELYRRFSLFTVKETEYALLSSQTRLQEQHYRELEENFKEISSIRHDMKNHFRTAALLYENNQREELLQYVSDITGKLEETEALIHTGNSHLDSILNLKLKELKRAGITCVSELAVPSGLILPFSDMVVIFGNLLDNAKAALLSESGADKRLTFSILYQNTSLFIHIENPAPSLTEVPPLGTGLKNVSRTVQKYNGTIEISLHNGNYIANLLLYGVESNKTP